MAKTQSDAPASEALLPSLLPALFPKKRADSLALRDALKEVRAIYYSGADDPTTCRIGHLTAHRLPQSLDPRARRLRIAALVALSFAWLLLYPRGEQVRSVLAACAYSVIEYAFEFLERGRPYTSAEQFLGNLVYTPLLLSVYGSFLLHNAAAYIILFPVNIWLLEIVQGHAYMWFYCGRNVAWCYLDYADVACNGCVRWGHGVWWIGLGAACLLIERHTPFGELAAL